MIQVQTQKVDSEVHVSMKAIRPREINERKVEEKNNFLIIFLMFFCFPISKPHKDSF